MTKTIEQVRRFVILNADRNRFQRYLSSNVWLCSNQAEIAKACDDVPDGLTWIAYSQKFTDELLKTVARKRATQSTHGCVLTVASPRPASLPTLHGLFSRVVGESPSYRWLPKDELSAVLFDAAFDRSEFFIAASADPVTRTLTLVRGDLRVLVLPYSFFEPSGNGTKPDFSKVGVADFGRTVALGDYEASADAVLYETDSDYRRKATQQRKEAEQTFGAALFRLRKQRKLKRADFAPLSAKTLARIERNEIDKPRGETLRTIAKRLKVSPEEIGDY